MIHLHHPTIEILESRIAPAGLVSVVFDAAGLLTLGGSTDPDNVAVFKTGPNSYRVEGVGTDIGTVGNVFSDFTGKLTGVVINAGQGDDSFSLKNLIGLGTVVFNGGDGDDTFKAFNLTTKGGVTANFDNDGGGATFDGVTSIGGDFTVNYGAGGGAVTMVGASVAIKGAMVLNGGAANDSIEFGPDKGSVGKGVRFPAAGGVNLADFHGLSVAIGKGLTGNSIEFTGGAAANTLLVGGTSMSLKGNVNFQGGADVDTLTLDSTLLKIDGKLTATLSGEKDTVSMYPGAGTIKGAVDINLGDGTANTVDIAPIVGLTLGGTLTVTGGASSDLFTISGGPSVAVKGAVLLDLGGGAGAFGNKVDLNSSVLNFGNSVTIKGSATSGVSVDSQATILAIKGLLDGQFGDGDNTFTSSAKLLSVGGLSLKTGIGTDTVELMGSTLKVGGNATVETADGDDTITFGYTAVDVKGGVGIDTGDGGDIVTFTADGAVKGDFVIDLGAGDAGFADLVGNSGIAGNLKIGGKLTVNSAANGVGNIDFITLKELTVGKAILITLGDVDSTLTIDNLFAKDTFTLNTGAGADVVNIEQDTLFGGSVFSKAVTIDLGIDDDTFRAGISSTVGSNSFVKFLAPVSVNGGAHNTEDRSNDFLNDGINFFAPGVLLNPLTNRLNFEGAFL